MARKSVHHQKVAAMVVVLISEQLTTAAESPLSQYPDLAEVEAGQEVPDDNRCFQQWLPFFSYHVAIVQETISTFALGIKVIPAFAFSWSRDRHFRRCLQKLMKLSSFKKSSRSVKWARIFFVLAFLLYIKFYQTMSAPEKNRYFGRKSATFIVSCCFMLFQIIIFANKNFKQIGVWKRKNQKTSKKSSLPLKRLQNFLGWAGQPFGDTAETALLKPIE